MTKRNISKVNFKDGEDFIDGIPMSIDLSQEDSLLPSPGTLTFYNDIRERRFYIEEEIGSATAIEFQKYVLAWNKRDRDNNIPVEERRPIKVFIFSVGGDVYAMNMIIDTILISKTPVYTYNMGMAFSAGLDILLAGHKRFCLERSQVLIHAGSSSTSGTASQVFEQTKNYERMVKEFGEWILGRTTIPETLYKRKKNSEWFMNAKEQIVYGVVDAIIKDIDEVL